MQAVILAGGAGTRLYPLTLNIPKAMIKIKGKPFILHLVEELKRNGIKDFVFCIGYLADQFKEFFGDGSRFGIKIAYSVEKKFMGTGGALKLAEPYLKSSFFVVNGDTYLPIDYTLAQQSFRRSRKMGLMVLYDNKAKIAQANINVNDKGLVIDYIKREKIVLAKKCQFLDAGVQIYRKTVLDLMPKGRFVSLEMDVFPKLMARKELAAYTVSQRYYDIGTPQRLRVIRKVL